MNNVVDEVLAGSPRYNIKDNGGTSIYSNVQIDLATQVTTAGTPLNKALFDSIQTDLNSRLLISNKATTGEATTGTNDTKYMTPKKVQDKFDNLTTSASYTNSTTTPATYTLVDFSNYSNKIISVVGRFHTSSHSSSAIGKLTIAGTSIDIHQSTTGDASGTSAVLNFYGASSSGDWGFELIFDLISKTITGQSYRHTSSSGSAVFDTILGSFDTITSLSTTITTVGANRPISIYATINSNR